MSEFCDGCAHEKECGAQGLDEGYLVCFWKEEEQHDGERRDN